MHRFEGDHLTIALLRADLPGLLPDRWEELDTQLLDLLAKPEYDPAAVMALLRHFPQAAARWRTHARAVKEVIERYRGPGEFTALPGDPAPFRRVFWICPYNKVTPPDCARLQRFPGQEMGECPTHHIPLIRQVSG